MGQSTDFYLLRDYKGFGDGTRPMGDGMMVRPDRREPLTNCAFVLKASIYFKLFKSGP